MTSPKAILEITDLSFAAKVMQSNVPVLLAFCAGECSASQRLETMLTNAALRRGFTTIARTSPADSPVTMSRLGIVSLPAVLLFNGGRVCYEFFGELSPRELDELLTRADNPTTRPSAATRMVTEVRSP